MTRVAWREALLARHAAAARGGHPLEEDPRSADWRFLLPLTGTERALVLGVGLGEVPLALAESCRAVLAIDREPAALAERARDLGLERLEARQADPSAPSVEREAFDLVSVNAEVAASLPDAAPFLETVRGTLRLGGILHLAIHNACSPLVRLREGQLRWTRRSTRSRLERAGFHRLAFYGAVPGHGIPMFLVPLESPGAIRHLVGALLPLADTLSPEVRGSFGWRLPLARAGARALRRLRLEPLLGWGIAAIHCLAEKTGKGAECSL